MRQQNSQLKAAHLRGRQPLGLVENVPKQKYLKGATAPRKHLI